MIVFRFIHIAHFVYLNHLRIAAFHIRTATPYGIMKRADAHVGHQASLGDMV